MCDIAERQGITVDDVIIDFIGGDRNLDRTIKQVPSSVPVVAPEPVTDPVTTISPIPKVKVNF